METLPPECEGDAAHCVVLTTYDRVNVYRNIGPGGFCTIDGRCAHPRNRYGARWQCVELFNRFFAQRFGTEPVPGDARDLFANARDVGDLHIRPNGGVHRPVAGDALVFTDPIAGHVAIVVGVTDGRIDVVEQNVPGDGTNHYRYDPVTNEVLDPSATMSALGWIHANANDP